MNNHQLSIQSARHRGLYRSFLPGYEVDLADPIGIGAFSTVYRAKKTSAAVSMQSDARFGREQAQPQCQSQHEYDWAVKVTHLSSTLQQTLHEQQILISSSIKGPNLVNAIQCVRRDNMSMIVYERCRGSLREVIQNHYSKGRSKRQHLNHHHRKSRKYQIDSQLSHHLDYHKPQFAASGCNSRLNRHNLNGIHTQSKTNIPHLLYIRMLIDGYNQLRSYNCIHRDIKPDNLLIAKDGTLKIADWGFALNLNNVDSRHHKVEKTPKITQNKVGRQRNSIYTATIMTNPNIKAAKAINRATENNIQGGLIQKVKSPYNVGSPYYMAPQALRYNEFSQKTDIWSIGVVIYELYTGQVPFKGTTEEEIAYNARVNLLSNPSGVIPNQVWRIITACLDPSSVKRVDLAGLNQLLVEAAHLSSVNQHVQSSLLTEAAYCLMKFIGRTVDYCHSKPELKELYQTLKVLYNLYNSQWSVGICRFNQPEDLAMHLSSVTSQLCFVRVQARLKRAINSLMQSLMSLNSFQVMQQRIVLTALDGALSSYLLNARLILHEGRILKCFQQQELFALANCWLSMDTKAYYMLCLKYRACFPAQAEAV